MSEHDPTRHTAAYTAAGPAHTAHTDPCVDPYADLEGLDPLTSPWELFRMRREALKIAAEVRALELASAQLNGLANVAWFRSRDPEWYAQSMSGWIAAARKELKATAKAARRHRRTRRHD